LQRFAPRRLLLVLAVILASLSGHGHALELTPPEHHHADAVVADHSHAVPVDDCADCPTHGACCAMGHCLAALPEIVSLPWLQVARTQISPAVDIPPKSFPPAKPVRPPIVA
jgi:hypothetical protein